MASVDSSSLWLAEQITDSGLFFSHLANENYPSQLVSEYGEAPYNTRNYTKVKDQALVILSLLPKYFIKSDNPQTHIYEDYYKNKIDLLVTSLLSVRDQTFPDITVFPEAVNESNLNIVGSKLSVSTTAWVIYALSEYYLAGGTIPVLDELKKYTLYGLLPARNLLRGQTQDLFSHSKFPSGAFSSDRYYILDSIISILALLKVSVVLSDSTIVTEEVKSSIYNTILQSYNTVIKHVDQTTGLPYFSIASSGIVDKLTQSSELLTFYGLLLYSFGEVSKIYTVLNSLSNFEFPKTQSGFAEFAFKYKELVVGYKPFLYPNVEMADPKISYLTAFLYRKLGKFYEAEELVTNVTTNLVSSIVDGIEYSYSVFCLNPSVSLSDPQAVVPWKSIEGTCWSILNYLYKDVFVDGYVNSPWGLSPLKKFLDMGIVDTSVDPGEDLNNPLNVLDSELKIFKKLVDSTYLIVAKYVDPLDTRFSPILLISGRDYKIDFRTNKLYISSKSIRDAFGFIRSSDDFLQNVEFELLFLSRIPEEDSTEELYADFNRDGHISGRKHSKFNRIIYKKVDASQELIKNSTTKESYLEVDSTDKKIVEVPEKARLFRKDLPESFPPTRTTLHRQVMPVQVNSPDEINPLLRYKNQIDYDLFNPMEKDNWRVRVLKNDLYQGAEQTTNGIWSNYFGVSVPRNSTEVTIPYTSVDVSPEAQVYSRDSLRWKDFLGTLTYTSVYDFLACRKESVARNQIWTRGSASRMARPYKSSHRTTGQEGDPVQGFRRDEVLFNRTDNISDYETISTSPDLDSNYLYETKKGSILNRSIFNITSNIVKNLSPVVNSFNLVHKDNITVNKIINGVKIPVTTTSSFKTLITSYKNIYYPVLSKEYERVFNEQNPTLVDTFDRYAQEFNTDYKGALNFTDRSEYYVKIIDEGVKKVTTSVKKTPYAGNLNIRACPKSGDLFQESFDKFTVEIGEGIIRYHDSFTIDKFENLLFPFKRSYPHILWFTPEGELINFGYSPVQFSNIATPNIKVRLNGIELEFGVAWNVTSDPVPAIHLIVPDKETSFICEGDTLTVEYDATGVLVDEEPTLGFNNLQTYVQRETIPDTFFDVSSMKQTPVLGKTNMIAFDFDVKPVIHWFRNTRGEFVNAGNNPNYYYDDVSPNISVKYNGIELTYLKEWRLDFNESILKVAILDSVGYKVNPKDSFIIEYRILRGNAVLTISGAAINKVGIFCDSTDGIVGGSSNNSILISTSSSGTADTGDNAVLDAVYYRLL